MRGVGKTIYLWWYVFVWSAMRNTWRRVRGDCHIVVLLYHRVSDDVVDPVTVSKARFRSQMALLKRAYPVVSLAEFLDGTRRKCNRPTVVVTFDDGYWDNYEAAGVLREFGIPCTFFVSTGMIGTERPFPRDARLNQRVESLDWEQVREMAEWGFDIANHSVTHIDMGREPVERSLEEIEQARQTINGRLGDRRSAGWLAIPFGKPANFRPELREQLSNSNIECCLSACGGINRRRYDPLDIRRQGVGSTADDLAFRAAVEGHLLRA